MSESAKRRAKERAKKAAAAEAEAAAAEVEALKLAALASLPAAGAGAASSAGAAEEVFDPAKELRKMLKKLKQVRYSIQTSLCNISSCAHTAACACACRFKTWRRPKRPAQA